jgi:hypothetical protein
VALAANHSRGDLTEIGGAQIVTRRAELGRIRNIEILSSELQPEALCQLEVLEDG